MEEETQERKLTREDMEFKAIFRTSGEQPGFAISFTCDNRSNSKALPHPNEKHGEQIVYSFPNTLTFRLISVSVSKARFRLHISGGSHVLG